MEGGMRIEHKSNLTFFKTQAKYNTGNMSIKLPDMTMGGIPSNENEKSYTKDDLCDVKDKIVEIVEVYLKNNFWVTHVYENGYPVKVIAKADFLGMLSEIKLSKV
jgi:hypothetical protein